MSSLPAPTPGSSFFARAMSALSHLGEIDGESSSQRIRRRTLIFGGALMSVGGLLWGGGSLALGLCGPSLIPFGYVAITILNFAALSLTRDLARGSFVQLAASLLLPFAFQWVIGGFSTSGAVMLWALVSLVGGLTLGSARAAVHWLVVYLILTVVSGLLDHVVAAHAPVAPTDGGRITMLVVNIVTVTSVVFGLAIYLNTRRDAALRAVEEANATVRALNDRLEGEIAARGRTIDELAQVQQALGRRTEELSTSLAELGDAQREIVRREKVAALGGLVAGVAHEVNTPLGVTVTAVSFAKEHCDELATALATSPADTRAAGDIAAALRDALTMASDNVARAAQLIENFKGIAVDQTSEAERAIELRSYVESVVASLAPMLRKERLRVVVTGDAVELVTRPGAIAQVVTNLVQNAGMHAFPADADAGDRVVHVRCGRDRDEATLEVVDSGVGMTPEAAARAFEPFFTTKRGAGGSGLGLHIVHSVAYEVLGGSIALDTAPGQGTSVKVRLPIRHATGAADA